MNRPQLSTVIFALSFSAGLSSVAAQNVRVQVSGTLATPVVPQAAATLRVGAPALALPGASLGAANLALPSLPSVTPAPSVRAAASPTALPAAAPAAVLFSKTAPGVSAPAAGLSAAGAAREENVQRAARSQMNRVEAVSQAMQKDLAVAGDAKSGGEASKDSAARLLEPSMRPRVESASPVVGRESSARSGLRRYEPLLSRVSFPEGATAEQKDLLSASLGRRKAAWVRGLERSGLKLADGQPEVTVLSVETRVSKKNPADYTVTYQLEWKYSDAKLGRVKVSVNSLKLEPSIYTLPLPTPPKERQLFVRFKTRTLESAGGLSREIAIGEKEIKAFAEGLGLRVLWHSYKGEYSLAAPASVDMAAVEKKLLASDLVVDARPAVYEVPAENQVKLAFKGNTKYGWADVMLPHDVDDSVVAAVLRHAGVRVLSVDFGVWTVGAPGLDAAAAARRIQETRMTLYAVPAVSDVPESRRVVVSLRRERTEMDLPPRRVQVSEDELGEFLRTAGVRVLRALSGGAYVLEVAGDSAAAAAGLAKHPLVERSAAVGSLSDEAIRAAASGVASYKGRPWSSTEYNYAWGTTRDSLEERGATAAQLELYEKLTAEAPVRGGGFNPWSGD